MSNRLLKILMSDFVVNYIGPKSYSQATKS